MVAPQRRKALVCHYIEDSGIGIRRACSIFNISVTCYYHKSVVTDENQQIADLLIKLTDENKNWGFGLCFLTLRNVLGLPYNHKRVYRIYCELELNLRIKPKRRIKRAKPIPLAVPDRINQSLRMDFMHDSLLMAAALDCSMSLMITTVRHSPLKSTSRYRPGGSYAVLISLLSTEANLCR